MSIWPNLVPTLTKSWVDLINSNVNTHTDNKQQNMVFTARFLAAVAVTRCSYIAELKCTETDLKKSQICPIWGQSDPFWMTNLTSISLMNVWTSAHLMYLVHSRHLVTYESWCPVHLTPSINPFQPLEKQSITRASSPSRCDDTAQRMKNWCPVFHLKPRKLPREL